MNLFYDERDDEAHQTRGSQILCWLDDLGARPISEASRDSAGFLFAGARPMSDYRQIVARLPRIDDRPDHRAQLMELDTVLSVLDRAGVDVPTPRTWRLQIDRPLPTDLTYPLFLRTAHTSLKLGGQISKVKNAREVESESAELRRLLGWNDVILAREWCDLAEAGRSVYGPVPLEIRTWIVDGDPLAWSFHYLNVVESPRGFPPSHHDLQLLAGLARRVGGAFRSRCIVADFALAIDGRWIFIEAGPGSCAGTAHEAVFKAVAAKLAGDALPIPPSPVGGAFGISNAV